MKRAERIQAMKEWAISFAISGGIFAMFVLGLWLECNRYNCYCYW